VHHHTIIRPTAYRGVHHNTITRPTASRGVHHHTITRPTASRGVHHNTITSKDKQNGPDNEGCGACSAKGSNYTLTLQTNAEGYLRLRTYSDTACKGCLSSTLQLCNGQEDFYHVRKPTGVDFESNQPG
jgi:hypothetical protein